MGLLEDIKVIFPDAKVKNGYALVKCPFHKGGMERRPSMSIILEKRDTLEPGFCRCFTCDWKGTFAEIAENFGMQYVPDRELIATEPKEKPVIVNTETHTYKKDVPYKFSPYLASRGISEYTQKEFRIYEREDEQKVYFPQFDKFGRYQFATARSTAQKQFFIPTGCNYGLYGIDLLDLAKPIAVCESQINVLTLHSAGYAHGVALLGATKTSALAPIKQAMGPFFLLFDGDEAGRKFAEKAADLLGRHKCVFFDLPEGKDVNDIWKDCQFNADAFYDKLESFRRNAQ